MQSPSETRKTCEVTMSYDQPAGHMISIDESPAIKSTILDKMADHVDALEPTEKTRK